MRTIVNLRYTLVDGHVLTEVLLLALLDWTLILDGHYDVAATALIFVINWR